MKHRLASVSKHTGHDFQTELQIPHRQPLFCHFNDPKVHEFFSGSSVTAELSYLSSGDEDL